MEKKLARVCQEHDLTTISVMWQHAQWATAHVYLHFDHGAEKLCVDGVGDSFDAALSEALAKLAVARSAEVAVA